MPLCRKQILGGRALNGAEKGSFGLVGTARLKLFRQTGLPCRSRHNILILKKIVVR
jgi:hypothetical protein